MIRSLRQLAGLLDRRAGLQACVMLAAIVLMALLEMTGVASILPVMRIVAEPGLVDTDPRLIRLQETFGLEGRRAVIVAVGVSVLVVFTVATAMSAFVTWLIQRCVWSMAHRVCMRLLRAYATMPYEFHLRHNSADLVKKVLVDVGDLVTGVLLAGANFIAQAILSLLIFGLMLAVRPTVALVAFAALAGSYGLIHLARHAYLSRLGRERLDASYARLATFTEAMTGVKAIRTEGVAPFFVDRFEDASRRFTELQPRYQLVRLLPRYLIELLALGGLVVVVLVMLTSDQALLDAIPALTFFAVAATRLLPALNRAFQGAAQVVHHLPAVEAVAADLRLAPDDGAFETLESRAAAAPLPIERTVRLEGVRFAYEPGRPVLDGVDLEVAAGTRVAIVGATGSGKTTLIDVLIGLLPPGEGRLLVDDAPVASADTARWRASIAYVPQDIFLYDDTIARNIAFGVPASAIDHERVAAAARTACIDDFITGELPDGYDTVIGERGVRLSGGQRQRLGLARAFYRRPSILVLDEATSALDGVTEQAVMQAIERDLPDATVVMIAHRLSTVRRCDVVHLMEGGRIVASGTYEALGASDPRMRELIRSTA